MLSGEIMGLLALGILWVNSALILAAALSHLRGIGELRRRLRDASERGGLVRGRVRQSADAGPLAVRAVRQTGRAITTGGPDRILFTDGAQSHEIRGGTVETDAGQRLQIAAAEPAASEVWTSRKREREATGPASTAQFEAAWRRASTFKGFGRRVEVPIEVGDEVWVLGDREGDRLGPGRDRPLIVSAVDPIAWCHARGRLVVAFVLGATVALGLCSGLALWPPHFGLISTIGGALCLAYFLAIQPLGTALRDAVRTPARRDVGGLWERSEAGAIEAGARQAGQAPPDPARP